MGHFFLTYFFTASVIYIVDHNTDASLGCLSLDNNIVGDLNVDPGRDGGKDGENVSYVLLSAPSRRGWCNEKTYR